MNFTDHIKLQIVRKEWIASRRIGSLKTIENDILQFMNKVDEVRKYISCEWNNQTVDMCNVVPLILWLSYDSACNVRDRQSTLFTITDFLNSR